MSKDTINIPNQEDIKRGLVIAKLQTELDYWREIAKIHMGELEKMKDSALKGFDVRLLCDGEEITLTPVRQKHDLDQISSLVSSYTEMGLPGDKWPVLKHFAINAQDAKHIANHNPVSMADLERAFTVDY